MGCAASQAAHGGDQEEEVASPPRRPIAHDPRRKCSLAQKRREQVKVEHYGRRVSAQPQLAKIDSGVDYHSSGEMGEPERLGSSPRTTLALAATPSPSTSAARREARTPERALEADYDDIEDDKYWKGWN